jgi:hypothetical protein
VKHFAADQNDNVTVKFWAFTDLYFLIDVPVSLQSAALNLSERQKQFHLHANATSMHSVRK